MNGPRIQQYYSSIERLVTGILDKEQPGYLASVDFEAYLDYLVEQLGLLPLEWYPDKSTVEPFTTRVQGYDRFFEQHFTREEPRLRLRVPVSAHPQRRDYFKLSPSTTWVGRKEPDWNFEGDVLVYDVDATEAAVERGLQDIEFWLGNRNKEIQQGNKNLRGRIQAFLENRKRRLEEQEHEVQQVLKNLNIPLHQDPNAVVKPVEIRPRAIRTVLTKPAPRTTSGEPTLKRDDVVALVDFVEQYARQFEITPVPFAKMSEEELRDSLIAMMNANYPGSASGETFNKLGKTDITLRVDSGNVLVCECKFWGGRKAYGDSLDQLFRYLTWRQNYGVLIHFSKLKDLTHALSEARGAIESHPSYVPGTLYAASETRFISRQKHPQDGDKLVDIFHLFFDLSL